MPRTVGRTTPIESMGIRLTRGTACAPSVSLERMVSAIPSRRMRSDVTQPRQKYLKGRSPLRLAVDVDLTLALLHDAVHRRETQPRSVLRPLRGKERLEDPALRLRVPEIGRAHVWTPVTQ